MYLARGKNGKLGRQISGRHIKGMGYDVKTEVARFATPQRDVCVTDQSIDREQYDTQMGIVKQAKRRFNTMKKKEAKQAEAARRYQEGRAHAKLAQGKKKLNRQNEVLKGYFQRRANMGEGVSTVTDLNTAKSMIIVPENKPEIDYQLPCNTAGVVMTPTADYKILFEVPDTEFKNVISKGADFEAQYPVGNPISRDGASYLDAGPSTDWDRFVFDSEQNVTRAAGGFDVNKIGGMVVGGTMLGRANGKTMRGYPVQNDFGRAKAKRRRKSMGDEFDDFEADYAYPEEEYVADEPEAPSEPSFWDRLTSGLSTGVAQGAQTGVQQAAQYQITSALIPGRQPAGQTPAQNAAARTIAVAQATNPVTKMGASIGLSPTMTYAILGAVGIGTALVLLKRSKA